MEQQVGLDGHRLLSRIRTVSFCKTGREHHLIVVDGEGYKIRVPASVWNVRIAS